MSSTVAVSTVAGKILLGNRCDGDVLLRSRSIVHFHYTFDESFLQNFFFFYCLYFEIVFKDFSSSKVQSLMEDSELLHISTTTFKLGKELMAKIFCLIPYNVLQSLFELLDVVLCIRRIGSHPLIYLFYKQRLSKDSSSCLRNSSKATRPSAMTLR